MPTNIDFTMHHGELTYGNPIYELGHIPRRLSVDAVMIDDAPVEFLDSSIPERLGVYLASVRKLRRKRIANSCVAFAAIMNSVEIKEIERNPFRDYDEDSRLDEQTDSIANTVPIVLAQGFHDGLRIPRHVVLPAHTAAGPNYLHKLGDRGPLCMSNLEDALTMFGCQFAFPVPESV
jgi:hypothetical protein